MGLGWATNSDTANLGFNDDQIVLGIQEIPPSHAMEMGKIMPDVADQ